MIVDGYVRVSQTRGRHGERFISPVVQREQIEGWARAHGAMVATVFEELDESGARADRPLLTTALERVERGVTQGLVVAKLDRFGRSLPDSLAAIARIRAAGGTFVSVQDGLDLSTDTGKLVLRIMLSMAEWELDRVRSQWIVAREQATARGVHMAGRPPTGYLRDADGRLTPDPAVAPHITELFERRARGETIYSLGKLLSERGIASAWGNTRWQSCSVRCIIRNRAYLGELRSGEFVNASAHLPLTTPSTWQAAQEPRMVGRHSPHRHATVLGGLVRCASCGHALHSCFEAPSRHRQRFYGCAGASAAGRCPSRAWISARLLEPFVEAAFFTHLRRRRPNARLAALRRDLEKAQVAIVRYRDEPRILATLGPERFADGLAKRIEVEQHILLSIDAELARNAAVGRTAEEWESLWPDLSVEERRDAMAEQIECVFVARGRRSVSDRVFICERGDQIFRTPRGKAATQIRSFDPNEHRLIAPASADPKPRWPTSRVRAELAAYLESGEEPDWPTEERFVEAGRGPLLREVVATGGPTRWCLELGLPAPRLALDYWTDERIRAELPRLLAGRTTFPSHREFTELGHQSLSRAMAHRGRGEWAAEFGLRQRVSGSDRRWTEEVCRATIAEMCADRDTYPSRAEFLNAGLGGLFHAVAVYFDGHSQMAAELGVRRQPPGPAGGTNRKTRETAR
jgi:DNA invertase Pin-like site-specific DNA recombinase